jgi:hypothetical protein
MAFFNYVNPWPEATNNQLASPLLSAGRRDAAVWSAGDYALALASLICSVVLQRGGAA